MLVIYSLVGCTVTTSSGTKTYTVSDILNTVDQTLSGNRPSTEGSEYDDQADSQTVLKNSSAKLLPSAQRLSWERLLFADMHLQPSFDFNEHVDAYMRIFRPELWKRYRNDEFELAAKRRESISMMKQSASTFAPENLFLAQTSFKFGSYDFNRGLFPLDSISESSFFSYEKLYSHSLPNEYKIRFTNPSMVGDLAMGEADAKAFLQKRKYKSGLVDRKVYAKLFFSNVKLEGTQHTFMADLKSIYIYSDPDHRLLLVKY